MDFAFLHGGGQGSWVWGDLIAQLHANPTMPRGWGSLMPNWRCLISPPKL